MDIIISNSGGVPIYDQITRQMKGLILRGELAEGEALPSMRLLAKELRISVITTTVSYTHLVHRCISAEQIHPQQIHGGEADLLLTPEGQSSAHRPQEMCIRDRGYTGSLTP